MGVSPKKQEEDVFSDFLRRKEGPANQRGFRPSGKRKPRIRPGSILE